LFTSAAAFWNHDMRAMALLVALCGALLPFALLLSLAVLHAPSHLRLSTGDTRFLFHAAHFVEHWAFPEVQVLAVFVALMRLGSLVDVTIGPGFWCYCAMAFFLVLAQRSFDFESFDSPASPRGSEAAASP
jgi:paraquat-inducible protein A